MRVTQIDFKMDGLTILHQSNESTFALHQLSGTEPLDGCSLCFGIFLCIQQDK